MAPSMQFTTGIISMPSDILQRILGIFNDGTIPGCAALLAMRCVCKALRTQVNDLPTFRMNADVFVTKPVAAVFSTAMSRDAPKRSFEAVMETIKNRRVEVVSDLYFRMTCTDYESLLPAMEAMMAQIGDRLTLLEVNSEANPWDWSFLKDAADGGRLVNLTTLAVPINDISVHQAVAKGCPKLKTWRHKWAFKDFQNPGLVQESYITRAADVMAGGCKQLRVVDLSYCHTTDDETLKALAKLDNLQELDVTGCTGISDAGVAAVAEKKTLRVFQSSLHHALQSRISDEGLLAVAECSQMRRFTANGGLSDRVVTKIGLTCSNLCDLKLWGCQAITNESIVVLARGCTKLETVRLTNVCRIGDAGFIALANGCPNLKHVAIYYPVERDRYLAWRSLAYASGELQATRFTDVGLAALALRVTQSLEVSGGMDFTNAGVDDIIDLCPPTLVLDLGFIGKGKDVHRKLTQRNLGIRRWNYEEAARVLVF